MFFGIIGDSGFIVFVDFATVDNWLIFSFKIVLCLLASLLSDDFIVFIISSASCLASNKIEVAFSFAF